jgi:CubicO group peptidase (beta-lactamase class C family)
MRSLLALALAGITTVAGAQDPAKVDAILAEQQRNEHIPGLALVVVKDGRVVLLRSLGLRDVEHGLPVTPDTLFPIGSCTKAFTAMALAASQDQGLLSLDDSPHRFLPYFKMADAEADALVTLRDMLSHRTGLKAYADLAAEPGVLTREQYLRAEISSKPVAKLRERFQYSNAMYAAAGEILAKAHGVPWESVIERTLFRPLGMAASVASLDGIAPDSDRATGYAYREPTRDWEAVTPPVSLRALAPAGAIASSANDMARWLRFLTAGGVLDGRRVVSEASFREVTRPHIAVNPAWSYALGWAVYSWNGHTVVEHNGGSRGISALVSFMPERGAGFVFLANTSPNFMTKIGNAGKLLWPVLLGEEPAPESVPSPSAPGPSQAPPEAGAVPTVDELLQRMIAAAGGEANLRRHKSMEVRAEKSYDNQGVQASLLVLAEAPNKRSEEESWTAAGTDIGRARVFFDGAHGGQETTFGQDETNGDEANLRASRDSALHPLLELTRLYSGVKVQRKGSVGDEATYVLDLTPSAGKPVALQVSARTALVLQRETEGETLTFSDFRNVDGEVVPFRITSQEALGDVSVEVRQVRFNVALPADAFSARAGR